MERLSSEGVRAICEERHTARARCLILHSSAAAAIQDEVVCADLSIPCCGKKEMSAVLVSTVSFVAATTGFECRFAKSLTGQELSLSIRHRKPTLAPNSAVTKRSFGLEGAL